jgi:succinyl-CoA synthetase beta subunit
MVNGAGLAMATCDLIRLKGADPANFLDVGGGASQEKVQKGFEILLRDHRVKAILVNIFGGIMNCEIIAQALKASLHGRKQVPPIVLRMEGTHVQEAKQIIKQAHLPVTSCDSLDDAADQVVQAG